MAKKQIEIDTKIKAVNSIINKAQTVEQICELLHVGRATVFRWLKKIKNSDSLVRKLNPLSGRQSKILGESLDSVIGILMNPASEFGFPTDFWTTSRMRTVLKKELNITASRMAIHRTLVKLGFSYKKPEKRYFEASPEKQNEWKNKTVPKIRKVIKKYNAILYFEDEASISLTPVIANTWGPVGEKTIAIVTGNRGSVSAISAISSDGRLIFNLHSDNKRFKSLDIINFLSQMLEHHKRRHLVVVMDQAPCHKSKAVQKFVQKNKRLHVFYLPPRSPEFNPDEKLWNHLKNHDLKSHKETNIKDLASLTKKKLKKLKKNKSKVRGIFRRSEGANFFA